jgi:hypothetical protein
VHCGVWDGVRGAKTRRKALSNGLVFAGLRVPPYHGHVAKSKGVYSRNHLSVLSMPYEPMSSSIKRGAVAEVGAVFTL